MLPVFVLNGPNLNLLGEREPDIYGRDTLEDIARRCRARAEGYGLTIDFRQTNHEGALVDWLQEARRAACAVVINPGAYTHTSVALLDAAKMLACPLLEVHLSNPSAREPFRRRSLISPAATGVIAGLGAVGYELAVEAAARLVGASGGSGA